MGGPWSGSIVVTRNVLSKMAPLTGRPTASCPSGGVFQSHIRRRHRLTEPPEAFRKRGGHLGILVTDRDSETSRR